MGPHERESSVRSELEEAAVVALRAQSRLPLDDVLIALPPAIPAFVPLVGTWVVVASRLLTMLAGNQALGVVFDLPRRQAPATRVASFGNAFAAAAGVRAPLGDVPFLTALGHAIFATGTDRIVLSIVTGIGLLGAGGSSTGPPDERQVRGSAPREPISSRSKPRRHPRGAGAPSFSRSSCS